MAALESVQAAHGFVDQQPAERAADPGFGKPQGQDQTGENHGDEHQNPRALKGEW